MKQIGYGTLWDPKLKEAMLVSGNGKLIITTEPHWPAQAFTITILDIASSVKDGEMSLLCY